MSKVQHDPYYNQQMHMQMPIQMQPTAQQFSAVPLNVPYGLEYLAHLDQIFVKQKIEALEVILGCETNNKYIVKDAAGRDMFTAKESTDFCTRQCCGNIRPFDLLIKDFSGQEVIHLTRPLACGSCCFPCCLQSIQIFAGNGELLGTIEQVWTFWIPKYLVKNGNGEVVLKIEGPCCTCACCADVDFKILSVSGDIEVGRISKKWSGLLKEAFTDADNFGITFPMDLDVKMKAVMLGALFLIDFMFFEHTEN
ncbi:phospholipid scramblase 1 [Folsomia candida]|nr:phospholipid scramblase 1 [Folsomia candida]XP_021968254.1 phospholipid scramblase 1 [Folsomia candida]XP_021968255.1 phospholipid scramblase 1 [Folsomia candida]XP_021968256.1 phospholipid scramblase 1 [Folsomia candida]XP_021968258.1 phospholipid scramblase 1 [Folsomia candida]XP_021968260.1 phospholipid scramblase 1 [Folsomia candida]